MPDPRLRIATSGREREVALDRERYTLGRAGDNDIVLDDPKVSRHHAVLERTPAGWKITDAGGRNGLRFEGATVVERLLEDGHSVSMGETTLTILMPRSAIAPRPRNLARLRETGVTLGVVAALGIIVWLAWPGEAEPPPAKKKTKKIVTETGVEIEVPDEEEPAAQAPPKKEEPKSVPKTDTELVIDPKKESVKEEKPAENRDGELEIKKNDAAPAKEIPATAVGRLVALTLEAVEKKGPNKPYVPVGKEQWQICGGTLEKAKVARWGKIQEIPWKSIPADGLYRAFKAVVKTLDDRFVLAEFALENDLVEEGFADLLAILKERPALKADIDRLLAKAFGEPVPEGGYVHFRDEWMTEAEKKVLLARGNLLAAVDEFARLKQVHEAKLQIKRDLRALQKKCVATIQSEEAYDNGNGKGKDAGQKVIDDLVKEMREIWNTPYDYVKRKYPDWNANFRTALDQLIAKKVDAPVDAAELETIVARHFDIKEFPLDGSDKSLIDQNRKVLDTNRRMWTIANDDERELLLIINEYRRMIGLSCASLDELLALASRHHSAEMVRLEYFGHTSPVPKRADPGSRAGEEGTGGGGENCYSGGTARGAFDGWYHSPGHHRNMISGEAHGPGISGMTTLQVAGMGPSVPKEHLLPAWLLEMRAHPVPAQPPSSRDGWGRGRYVRLKLAVLRWLTAGTDPDAIRQFRAGAKAFQPWLIRELNTARGPWLGVLLDLMGELRARESLEYVLAYLDSPDDWIRYLAAEALGKFAGIEDAKPATREGETVAEGAKLAEPVAKRIARRLVEQLTREKHEPVIAATLAALVEIGWPEGLVAVRTVRAQAGSWRHRYWAVKAIARDSEQLTLSLVDERRAVREWAVLRVKFDGNPAFEPLVESSRGKPGEYLLVFHAPDRLWATVVKALHESLDPEVRLHAAVALARMPRPEVEKALLKTAAGDKLFDVRWHAWRSLMRIAPDATRALLAEAAARETGKDKRARLEELLK